MHIKKVVNWALFLLLLSVSCHASVEVIGSLKHLYKGMPGEVYTGEIKLQNSGDTDQEVRVYQTNLLYNFEEFTYYEESSSHPRSNKGWINFSPKTLVIKAKEVRYIQYEITIPDSSSILGTYWSVIMVEGVNQIDPNQEGELKINTVTRYAIQMVTEINDPGEGSLKFLKPTLVTEGEKLFLAIDLVNTGEHYIAPELSMELFDESGVSVKVLKARKKALFPTTSARFRLDLQDLQSEKTYECLIIAAGDNDDVFGLEYTLFF